MITIVDYGGQYVHRIWRSLRYLGEPSEICGKDISVEEIKAKNPKGIILSGGPFSVYADQEQLGDYQGILALNLPILGICLGHQLIGLHFGGEVKQGDSGEYAEVDLEILDEDELFKNIPEKIKVWMSHRDEVVKLPPGFTCLAKSASCPIQAMKHEEKAIFSVQFHPEVNHTPQGADILRNFLDVCEKHSG